jgi:hypothetical protein
MISILFVGITAALAIAATITIFGFGLASAQMADNATMGNMTAGNMTAGNMTAGVANMTVDDTMQSGKISGCGVVC